MIRIPRRTYDQIRQQKRELVLEKKSLQRTVLTMSNDLLKLRQEYGDVSAAFLQLSAMFFDLIHTVSECCDRGEDKRNIYETVVRGAELFFSDCAVPGAAEKMEAAKNASAAEDGPDGDEFGEPEEEAVEDDEDYADEDDEDEDVTDYIPPEVRKILASYQKKH